MARVAELAKFKLRDVPEFAALTLPPSSTTAQRLIAAADAMADAVSPHARCSSTTDCRRHSSVRATREHRL
jgi:acyl transferase domain-containing protein